MCYSRTRERERHEWGPAAVIWARKDKLLSEGVAEEWRLPKDHRENQRPLVTDVIWEMKVGLGKRI